MRRILLLIVLCGIALCVWTRRAHAQSAPAWASPDSVLAAEHARREALLAADTVRLGRLVADDFMEISRLGTVRTRADNIGEIATGTLHLAAIAYHDLAARIYGNVAVLTGVSENAGTYNGTPFAGRVRYTRVFVHRDGRWQAVEMQQTPTAVPDAAGRAPVAVRPDR